MKVDSHEHGGQTQKYHESLIKNNPEMKHFFFITLGMGEYYLSPDSDKFKWINLFDCLRAVNDIQSSDQNISNWRELLTREYYFRKYCNADDYENFDAYQSTNSARKNMWKKLGWNQCFLGELKKELERNLTKKYLSEREPAVYTEGTKPDVVFNLAVDVCNDDGAFLMIDDSGLLKLKMNTLLRDGTKSDINCK